MQDVDAILAYFRNAGPPVNRRLWELAERKIHERQIDCFVRAHIGTYAGQLWRLRNDPRALLGHLRRAYGLLRRVFGGVRRLVSGRVQVAFLNILGLPVPLLSLDIIGIAIICMQPGMFRIRVFRCVAPDAFVWDVIELAVLTGLPSPLGARRARYASRRRSHSL